MISERLQKAMNEQVKHELESSYLYLSMGSYFQSLALDGMAHWMRCQAHEETMHAMKFFDHINDRGGKVQLQDIHLLKSNWKSPIEAWQDAYKHEQFITSKIQELTAITREDKEYSSEPILAWFLNEQIEEETNTSKISTQIEMLGENSANILFLDKELATRPFTPGSPFDPTALPQ
ncbi:MAG: ferritin [Desulfobacterales bacterium]|nr:ferritin [Desulfobacterales bacterium]